MLARIGGKEESSERRLSKPVSKVVTVVWDGTCISSVHFKDVASRAVEPTLPAKSASLASVPRKLEVWEVIAFLRWVTDTMSMLHCALCLILCNEALQRSKSSMVCVKYLFPMSLSRAVERVSSSIELDAI
eukprot:4064315-Amphidinium_carterae.1